MSEEKKTSMYDSEEEYNKILKSHELFVKMLDEAEKTGKPLTKEMIDKAMDELENES